MQYNVWSLLDLTKTLRRQCCRRDLRAAFQKALPAGSKIIESLLSLAAFALAAAWPPISHECSPHNAYSDVHSVTGSDEDGVLGEVLTEASLSSPSNPHKCA